MKRFVGGIILLIIGVANLFDFLSKQGKQTAAGAVIIIPVGIILIYFGWRFLKRRKMTLEIALEMFRKDRNINAAELATRLKLSELEIREYINYAKKKGQIPTDAEII